MDFIKDADCTKETPVRLGVPDAPIYGKGIKLKPRVDGRTDSEHFKKIYLPELLPLEEYDLIVVLISGGKDSVACYLKLLELGVPKERIEFWHHDIDGGHPSRRMDWKCTQNYVKALADAEGIKLRVSYRVNGFFGELYRIGASEPIEWIDPDTGEVRQCKLSSNYLKCKELKEQATEEMEELLKQYVLWSSFFVTLVAKKIVLINLCCRPCFIWGSITIITVWTNMIIINVCKFFYLLIECFLCCKLIQICAFILQGIEITLHRCIVVRISCFAHALCHIYRFAEFGKCFGRIL